jgi:hypothetical protein
MAQPAQPGPSQVSPDGVEMSTLPSTTSIIHTGGYSVPSTAVLGDDIEKGVVSQPPGPSYPQRESSFVINSRAPGQKNWTLGRSFAVEANPVNIVLRGCNIHLCSQPLLGLGESKVRALHITPEFLYDSNTSYPNSIHCHCRGQGCPKVLPSFRAKVLKHSSADVADGPVTPHQVVRTLVKDISLEVKSGELFAIMGGR